MLLAKKQLKEYHPLAKGSKEIEWLKNIMDEETISILQLNSEVKLFWSNWTKNEISSFNRRMLQNPELEAVVQ